MHVHMYMYMYIYIYIHIYVYIYIHIDVYLFGPPVPLHLSPLSFPALARPLSHAVRSMVVLRFFFLESCTHSLVVSLSLSRNTSRSLLLSGVVRVRSASLLLSLTLADFHFYCLSINHELTHSITSVITCTQVLLLPPWCNLNLLYSPISAYLFRGLCQQVLRLFWLLRIFWVLCFQYHVISVFLSHVHPHTHIYISALSSHLYACFHIQCM